MPRSSAVSRAPSAALLLAAALLVSAFGPSDAQFFNFAGMYPSSATGSFFPNGAPITWTWVASKSCSFSCNWYCSQQNYSPAVQYQFQYLNGVWSLSVSWEGWQGAYWPNCQNPQCGAFHREPTTSACRVLTSSWLARSSLQVAATSTGT